MNERLSSFLNDQSSSMAEEWLQGRDATTSKLIEQTLREQHQTLTTRLASYFIKRNDRFLWVQQLAQDRYDHSISLRENVHQIQRSQVLAFGRIRQFADMYPTEITTGQLSEWFELLQLFFKQLLEHFVDFYHKQEASEPSIFQMGAPVIPLTTEIGILPLTGEINTHRATVIQEQTMQKVTKLKLAHLIIDLSGVASLDTTVADEVFTVIKQLSLLGVQVAIAGIRPEIAVTSVQLGIDFTRVLTFANVQSALYALYHKAPR
ncbi:piezosome protein [Fictibacillus macauensis ZFHKF-1]|uniref:Piezosome protein n=2 Tax=Fictibacillus TaxID=1329200 RepID=I8UAK1_9BACL|nr:piezosome protein [Fictibacillus macauensis ZFHKF-1]